MYHGNSYNAEPPDTWPIFEVLIVFTASTRRVRSTSSSAWRAGVGAQVGFGALFFSLLLEHFAEFVVRATRAGGAPPTPSSHNATTAPSAMAGHIRSICKVSAPTEQHSSEREQADDRERAWMGSTR